MNEYVAIAANDESENIFYIVIFKYVPYTLQEYMESDGNQLAYGDPVCNSIYIYPGRYKPQLFCRTTLNTKNGYCVNENS